MKINCKQQVNLFALDCFIARKNPPIRWVLVKINAV